jgi:hypothetical protein
MGSWEDSPLGWTGSQLNIQDALTAIDRVLRDGQVDLVTRDVLVRARVALRDENS